MTDLERLHRAMLLDPYDLLAQSAYRDAWIEAGREGEPELLTHWTCNLRTFLAEAKEMFGRHPLTAVALVDRKPSQYGTRSDDNMMRYWYVGPPEGDYRERPEPDTFRHRVPSMFLELFPGSLPHDDRPDRGETTRRLTERQKKYASPAEAFLALSVACVAHGRALAGLPELKITPVCPTPTR